MSSALGGGANHIFPFTFNKESTTYNILLRQCPGLNLVDSSVWLLIASTLATLDISKAVDERGDVIEPEVKYENPIFRYVIS